MSIEQLLEEINTKVFNICFESNPIRKGWELHEIEPQNFTIKDNPLFYDKYYLIECYTDSIEESEMNLLYGYADGLIQKAFYNFMGGRTSLSEQINTSMTDWEKRFKKDIIVIDAVIAKRNTFIQSNI